LVAGVHALSQRFDSVTGGMAASGVVAVCVQWLILSALSLLLAAGRRAMEASRLALIAANQRLGAEVSAQTALIEAQQQQIFEATKHEALATLAGGVAHDFNNLLQGIQSNVEYLRGEIVEPTHVQELELIQHCVDSGADLVRDLLGYGRADKADVRPLDAARLVERTARIFWRAHRGVRLETQVALGIGRVSGDFTQLQQVLLNILNNAAQAVAEHGHVWMEAAAATLGGAPAVAVTVRDDGPGMDEETRRRAFEPFFTTKGKGLGTGLGLASAFGIVERHGGRIDVDTAPGAGATFTVLLPSLAEDAQGEAAAAPAVWAPPWTAPAPAWWAAPAAAAPPAAAQSVAQPAAAAQAAAAQSVARPGAAAEQAATGAEQAATGEPQPAPGSEDGAGAAGRAATGEPQPAATAPEPAPGSQDGAGAAGRATAAAVPVVDDEAIVRSMTERVLRNLGYAVHVAGSGDEAVDVMVAHGADIGLVLLDMIMPDTTGGEVFDRLRQLDPDVRVLLSTGYAGSQEAKELVERGCLGVLAKPYSMNELRDRVHEALAG
jgi:signal transduction histidine kinase/CheY-like chemotaxis protein